MGIERSTFIVAPDGRIKKIFRRVKPAGHAEKVLAAMV
jgi:peroxiredoxin Q/BCP